MTALIAAWSVVRANWKLVAGIALGAFLCFPLAYCQGRRDGAEKVEAAAAVATVEVMSVDANAKEVAAIERRNDDTEIAAKRQELIDAVSELPDALPSARRVALACQRLQQQGTPPSYLPSACRSTAGSKAQARP